MDKVVAIVGATAVGKTALSFALAEKLKAPLISGDAYQVYKHMDIGTAKPTPEELRQFRHYFINILQPEQTYSAAQFCIQAKQYIAQYNEQHAIPIVVGGTGLYIQALLEGYEFGAPQSVPAIRTQVIQRIKHSNVATLKAHIYKHTQWEPRDWHELLANKNRLIRLLEAIELGQGKEFIHASKASSPCYDAYVIGLSLPRSVLYERIEKRIDMMIQQGWIDEVRYLLQLGCDMESQAMKAIGYRELAAYIRHELSLEKAVMIIKKRTRQFAKRQITWFKRMPYIHWFAKETYGTESELIQDVMANLPWDLQERK